MKGGGVEGVEGGGVKGGGVEGIEGRGVKGGVEGVEGGPSE